MWKEGRISCTEFNDELQDFLAKSRTLGDDWEVRSAPEYLQLDPAQPVRCVVKQHFREITKQIDKPSNTLENDELSINEEDDDCEFSDNNSHKQYGKYEYHVIYSPSYGVPVLYFTAYTQDGCPLSLNDVWSAIPSVYQQRFHQERWTFLTQQEHPFLGKPFFQLHPCHTADMMKNICTGNQDSLCTSDRKANYLVTWLSSVGPVVGLNLSLGYAMNQDSK